MWNRRVEKTKRVTPNTIRAITFGIKSCRVEPFIMIPRTITKKYFIGLMTVSCCSHSGIFEMGVKKPEVSIVKIERNQVKNIACCCVEEIVETNMPRPSVESR